MKKIEKALIVLTAILIFNTNSFAQSGNCVKQGNVIIDAYYGYPYITGAIIKSVSNSGSSVKNLNHIGGRAEFMISDQVGLGVEFTFANASISYNDSANLNQYTLGIRKYRILGKMNYHFATTESIDPYFTIGAGLKKTTFYDNGTNNNEFSFNLVPVAIRFGVGVRYFFNDFIGLNAEVGLGGPLMQVGVSVKF